MPWARSFCPFRACRAKRAKVQLDYLCNYMPNAAPEVRADADYITLSNEEDGVAAALEHFGM